MQVKPLHNNVLIRGIEKDKVTPGGIIIPDTKKERANEGYIISVGEQAKEVQIGDRVLFGKYVSTDVKLENETLMMVKEEDIMGIISREVK